MKTIAKILAVIAAAACMAVVGIGCGPKGYVDKSNAVELGAFDRPDYAREMEEKHDREGREHIEIPDGAKTITIDGEEYIPIIDLSEVDQSNKNYIMKCDIDGRNIKIGYTEQYPFQGKFHGNNFKIKGRRNRPIFGFIENAVISNIVLASELEFSESDNTDDSGFLIHQAKNSVIKHCVNYASSEHYSGVIIDFLINGTVDDCDNYSDMYGCAGIVYNASYDFVIRNCDNYGNISRNEYGNCCGGVVGSFTSSYRYTDIEETMHGTGEYTHGVIENCNNYGKIIGCRYLVGGIVGGDDFYKEIWRIREGLENGTYSENAEKELREKLEIYDEEIIKYEIVSINKCNNYGDIYRNKGIKSKKIYGIGGIVGIGSGVRNCTNNGNIYGYETLHPDITAEKIGGVAGGAYIVEDCTSTTQLKLADTIVQYGDICGFLAKD